MAISVDYTTLHAAANDVRTTRGEINGELDKLRGVVDMLAGAWKGAAGSGFQNLMLRWSEDTEKLLQAMDSIAEMLGESGVSHQVADEEQQQVMNRYNSLLNP